MKKYFRHKLQNLISVTKVITTHYLEFEKSFRSEMEAHDFWELVYVDHGCATSIRNNESIYLEKGNMLFHKPNEMHSLTANGSDHSHIIIICFECKSLSMQFFNERLIQINSTQEKLLYNIISEAKRTFDIPYSYPECRKMPLLKTPTLGGEQLIKNYLEILLIDLMRELTETDGKNSLFLKKKDFDSKPVSEVMKILTGGVEKSLSADNIASAVGYSKAYIFKEFKKSTGKTIMCYYCELKIERAKRLLREGEMTIKEIAEKLSFDSANYFSKVFKKSTGLTPSAYKKREFTSIKPKFRQNNT